MEMSYRKSGLTIAAGICWILAGLLHLIGFCAGGSGGSGAIVVVFGIISAIMMVVSGIMLFLGDLRVLMITSIVLGVELAVLAIFTLFILVHGIIVLLFLAFIAFAIGFICLGISTSKMNRGIDIASSWIAPIVSYAIGMVMFLITALTATSMISYTAFIGRIVTGQLLGGIFLLFGPVLAAIILTGIDMHKSQHDVTYGSSYRIHPQMYAGINPYRQQGNMYYGQQVNPYYGQQANPYYGQQANPYYGQQVNPYHGQQMNPYYGQQANPYYGQQVNPYYGQQPAYGRNRGYAHHNQQPAYNRQRSVYVPSHRSSGQVVSYQQPVRRQHSSHSSGRSYNGSSRGSSYYLPAPRNRNGMPTPVRRLG